MRITNFGSLNIDHVYKVDSFVQPGETIRARTYSRFPGGKGLNQSVALARAGVKVRHAGLVGSDGSFLVSELQKNGVDVSFVQTSDAPTGHAVIQVNKDAENSIVVFGGANECLSDDYIQLLTESLTSDDFVLIQNEINSVETIIKRSKAKGVKICFNAAPYSEKVSSLPLEDVTYLFVNENEARGLTGENNSSDAIQKLSALYPRTHIIMTLGSKGATYIFQDVRETVQACKVTSKDTTGAGDTFVGFYMAFVMEGHSPKQCLEFASRAAAISTTREGAASSIPSRDEVVSWQFL
jgi:ribokinase